MLIMSSAEEILECMSCSRQRGKAVNRATSCHSLLHTKREGVEGLAGLVEVLGGEGVRSEVRQVLQPVCNAQQLPIGAVPAGTSVVSSLRSVIVGAPPIVAEKTVAHYYCAGAHRAATGHICAHQRASGGSVGGP